MQVKICHRLFPYQWECFEIGLKISCKVKISLRDSLRWAHWSKQQATPPPPGKAAWRGTSKTCSSAKKLCFTVVFSALESVSVLVWAGYVINLDLSETIMLREGEATERRVRKIIQTTSCRSTGSSWWKIHVDKSTHLLLLRLSSSEVEIRISGINTFTWLIAQSGFELIYLAKGNFFTF